MKEIHNEEVKLLEHSKCRGHKGRTKVSRERPEGRSRIGRRQDRLGSRNGACLLSMLWMAKRSGLGLVSFKVLKGTVCMWIRSCVDVRGSVDVGSLPPCAIPVSSR